jgi:hypothetical protein
VLTSNLDWQRGFIDFPVRTESGYMGEMDTSSIVPLDFYTMLLLHALILLAMYKGPTCPLKLAKLMPAFSIAEASSSNLRRFSDIDLGTSRRYLEKKSHSRTRLQMYRHRF